MAAELDVAALEHDSHGVEVDVPFWERERGDGPVTRWARARERAYERAQERRLQLMDLSSLRGTAAEPRRRISSRSYKERRALGLCTVCEEPTTYARCDKCRESYNLRPSRLCRQKG